MSVHALILATLRRAYDTNPIAGYDVLLDDDDNFVIRHLFQNYRNANGLESGLRLSDSGQSIISKYFKQWSINLTATKFGSRELIWLDRICQMPWYIIIRQQDSQSLQLTLYLMEAELAMRAKLVGDFDALKTAFTENNS